MNYSKYTGLEVNMKPKGFTLTELLIVIIIVAILAGLAVPLIRGRVNQAKWSEANAAAGMIRNAIKARYAESQTCPLGQVTDEGVMEALDIAPADLTGSYFVPGDYEIISINEQGIAQIRVTGSLPHAPEGSRTLDTDGSWK